MGLQLSDLYRNIRVKILICAVARGSEAIIPTGMFTLRAGDKIYLTASARDLESFFRKLNLFKAKASNVAIVGASRMTYYLVKELQDIQKRVTVIDSDAARCQEMSEVPRRAGHPRRRCGCRAAERGASPIWTPLWR